MSDNDPPEKASQSSARPVGTTGDAVRKNLRRIRDSQGMSGPQLSARLKTIGRPIPPLGIHRIENGTRRVDVDDLVNLAAALDVSPVSLLMPDTQSPETSVSMGPWESLPASIAWQWLRAELSVGSGIAGDDNDRSAVRYYAHSRPVWERQPVAGVWPEGVDTAKLDDIAREAATKAINDYLTGQSSGDDQ